MTDKMKKWIEEQEKKIKWQKANKNSNNLEKKINNLPEHILVTDENIIIYYDKYLNVVNYVINKKEIKSVIDILRWTRDLSCYFH